MRGTLSLPRDGDQHAADPGSPAVLEEIDPLPRAEGEGTLDDRDRLRRGGQSGPNVRRHVIGAFGGVRVVRCVFRGKKSEGPLQVVASGGVGVLLNHETRRGVTDEDVAEAPNGDLFIVVDSTPGTIRRVSPDGNIIDEWEPRVSESETYVTPMGVAVDQDGFVYVVDDPKTRVAKFTPDGVYVDHWTTFFAGDGTSSPFRIVIDNSGDLFVADYTGGGYGRIKKFSSTGERLGN